MRSSLILITLAAGAAAEGVVVCGHERLHVLFERARVQGRHGRSLVAAVGHRRRRHLHLHPFLSNLAAELRLVDL